VLIAVVRGFLRRRSPIYRSPLGEIVPGGPNGAGSGRKLKPIDLGAWVIRHLR